MEDRKDRPQKARPQKARPQTRPEQEPGEEPGEDPEQKQEEEQEHEQRQEKEKKKEGSLVHPTNLKCPVREIAKRPQDKWEAHLPKNRPTTRASTTQPPQETPVPENKHTTTHTEKAPLLTVRGARGSHTFLLYFFQPRRRPRELFPALENTKPTAGHLKEGVHRPHPWRDSRRHVQPQNQRMLTGERGHRAPPSSQARRWAAPEE